MNLDKLLTTHLRLCEVDQAANLMPGEAVYNVMWMPSDSVIGKAKIMSFGEDAEIGYTINERQRHKGFGTAACRHVTDLALCTFPEVFAQVDKCNLASIQVLEKNGFHPTDDLGNSIIYTKIRP